MSKVDKKELTLEYYKYSGKTYFIINGKRKRSSVFDETIFYYSDSSIEDLLLDIDHYIKEGYTLIGVDVHE